MKRKMLIALAACMSLSACASSVPESVVQSTLLTSTSTTIVEIPEETIPTTTTTVAPIPRTALPKLVNCPLQKISSDTSEVFKEIIRCVDGWAVGIPQRFVEKFNGDTNVEAEWVLTNKPGKWTVVGVCHIYHPMTATMTICNNPYNDNPVDDTLVPPMPVQCVLWFGASLTDKIPETGCPEDSYS
jgi:hypothetical protein